MCSENALPMAVMAAEGNESDYLKIVFNAYLIIE